jgi:hypothetical protein
VLVFDEAQRAYDADKMRDSHDREGAASEPEEFIQFADRIPEWCVVVGLIGTGQEIHVGEEAGLGQWRRAVEASHKQSEWSIHGPPSISGHFRESSIAFESKNGLNLDTELRFHAARDLHRFVGRLLDGADGSELAPIGQLLNADGYHLRITRDLNVARTYLRERYSDDRSARFGIVASSRDRILPNFGVLNDYQSTKRVRVGPWYGEDEDDYAGNSCRLMETCVTEFGAQGLELDAALLAWGTDLVRVDARWSSSAARGYKRGTKVRDPHQLRINSYRVLLTRGRDATVVFVPPLTDLDETFKYLAAAGFVELRGARAY